MDLSINTVVKEVWSKFKQNVGILLSLGLLSGLVSFLTVLLTGGEMSLNNNLAVDLTEAPLSAQDSGILILGAILTIILQTVIMLIALKIFKGQKPSLGEDFQQGLKKAWGLFVRQFVAGLLIILGLILFIVPGIILMFRYTLVSQVYLDQGLGIKDTLKESRRLTQGLYWKLLALGLVALGISFVAGFAVGLPIALIESEVIGGVASDILEGIIGVFAVLGLSYFYLAAKNNKQVAENPTEQPQLAQ